MRPMSHCRSHRAGSKVPAMNNPHILTLTAVVAAAALAPTTALAKHGGDGDASARGSCTKSSSAKLKVKPDDGRLEAEFEVDQNRNGVRWRVTLSRNGKRVAATTATTRAPSGSFEVRRRLANGAGSDPITPRATSPSGEVSPAGPWV